MRDPRRARDGVEEKLRQPPSELPARTPVPTHRYKPREVRRQGYPRESRSPSRRVVVKLGSWSACADGAPYTGAPSSISAAERSATHRTAGLASVSSAAFGPTAHPETPVR